MIKEINTLNLKEGDIISGECPNCKEEIDLRGKKDKDAVLCHNCYHIVLFILK